MFRSLIEKVFPVTGRTPVFADDDHRVAAAALLVRTVGIDGTAQPAERAKVLEVIKRGFGLDERVAGAVLTEAERRDREAADLSDFTAVLRRALSDEGRARIVELLWEVSYVDGSAHEFEESVIGRVAYLLGVADQDSTRFKRDSDAT